MHHANDNQPHTAPIITRLRRAGRTAPGATLSDGERGVEAVTGGGSDPSDLRP